MKVSFDFLSEPLELSAKHINTLCIENHTAYRNIVQALISEEPESCNIIFSENFTPFKFKGNVCFIDNIFSLNFSNSVIKKLHEQIEKYCNSDLQSETTALKTNIVNYLELIVKAFDYDLECSYDIDLLDLFKIQNIKPYVKTDSLLENLLNFILFISNYTAVKCFVLLNVHLYFSQEELTLFYNDAINNHIKLLILENTKFFEGSCFERITICDKDMCEIVEKSEY